MLKTSLHRIMLLLLKVIPIVVAFCYILNTFFTLFGIDLIFLSYLAHMSILSLVFFYVCSYIFGFCLYHRMFLHYIVINELINVIDYYIGIPLNNWWLFSLHIVIIGITLFIILYSFLKNKKKNTI